MKCPICKKENNSEAVKEWIFQGMYVNRFVCSICGEKYNTYSIDGKVKFTIPKQEL